MKLLIVCIIGAIISSSIVLIVFYGRTPDMKDEDAEKLRKQLNEWQDNDNNLND